MKEILELMKKFGVKKIELVHLVDMSKMAEDSGEDVMVVNTIEKDQSGTLVCYDNRDEDEEGRYQPLWNVAQMPKELQDELLFSVRYSLKQVMLSEVTDAALSRNFSDKIDDIDLLEYYYKDDEGEVSTFEDRFDCIDTTTIPASVWFICGTDHEDINVPLSSLTFGSMMQLYNCINK